MQLSSVKSQMFAFELKDFSNWKSYLRERLLPTEEKNLLWLKMVLYLNGTISNDNISSIDQTDCIRKILE